MIVEHRGRKPTAQIEVYSWLLKSTDGLSLGELSDATNKPICAVRDAVNALQRRGVTSVIKRETDPNAREKFYVAVNKFSGMPGELAAKDMNKLYSNSITALGQAEAELITAKNKSKAAKKQVMAIEKQLKAKGLLK